MDIKQRIKELTEIINKANHEYYILDNPSYPIENMIVTCKNYNY